MTKSLAEHAPTGAFFIGAGRGEVDTTVAMENIAGEVIKRYRLLHDFSRPDLARLTNMSAAAIEAYEQRGTHPSRDAAKVIDEALSADGAILVACGYPPVRDWGAEIASLRDEVASLSRGLQELTSAIENLRRREH